MLKYPEDIILNEFDISYIIEWLEDYNLFLQYNDFEVSPSRDKRVDDMIKKLKGFTHENG